MSASRVRLFVCGDVACGRGIDQILPCPNDPRLHERVVQDARRYVELAERASGMIPRPVSFFYVWGDALLELDRRDPDIRIINLETAVTTSEDAEEKAVLYRMHPGNVAVLRAASIDCCSLANNHVLDWGRSGLDETLSTLHEAGVRTAGAGRNAAEAHAPAIFPLPGGGRILIYGLASPTSGVPQSWEATKTHAGVSLMDESDPSTVRALADRFAADRRSGDLVVASIHWGSNFGYDIPDARRALAHGLIEAGAASFTATLRTTFRVSNSTAGG